MSSLDSSSHQVASPRTHCSLTPAYSTYSMNHIIAQFRNGVVPCWPTNDLHTTVDCVSLISEREKQALVRLQRHCAIRILVSDHLSIRSGRKLMSLNAPRVRSWDLANALPCGSVTRLINWRAHLCLLLPSTQVVLLQLDVTLTNYRAPDE
jgi:hypothetical protein